jgi:hypothetical protein
MRQMNRHAIEQLDMWRLDHQLKPVRQEKLPLLCVTPCNPQAKSSALLGQLPAKNHQLRRLHLARRALYR